MVSRAPATRASELLDGLARDAVAMVDTAFATRTDVDTAMRLGAGHPVGPFGHLDDSSADQSVTASPDPTSPGPTSPDHRWVGPVGVLGTGHMAGGIVESIARAGRDVQVVGRGEDSGRRLLAAVTSSLQRSVARGRLAEEDATAALSRVRCTVDLDDLAGCPVVVEAVAEDLSVKHDVLGAAHAVLPADTVLATNTSSFRVAEVAGAVARERLVMALHFFNPAPAMRLVEVVMPADPAGDDPAEQSHGTGPAAHLAAARAFVAELGKTAVTCGDQRGFIVNRLLIPYLNDAVAEVARGVPTAAVDEALREEAGHPMGPLAIIDLIGVDVTVAALWSLHEATGSDRIAPHRLLLDLVARGDLGRKTRRGFFAYDT